MTEFKLQAVPVKGEEQEQLVPLATVLFHSGVRQSNYSEYQHLH